MHGYTPPRHTHTNTHPHTCHTPTRNTHSQKQTHSHSPTLRRPKPKGRKAHSPEPGKVKPVPHHRLFPVCRHPLCPQRGRWGCQVGSGSSTPAQLTQATCRRGAGAAWRANISRIPGGMFNLEGEIKQVHNTSREYTENACPR